MAFRELPFKIVLMQEFLFIHILHLRRVCLGEVRAEVAIFATYIANYAKYSKLDSVFNPTANQKDEDINYSGMIFLFPKTSSLLDHNFIVSYK